MEIKAVQEKLQNIVNTLCEQADESGSSTFSTCDHSNWDKDYWVHRYTITDAIRNRGYKVNGYVKHGVTDYVITKPIQLT
jgi:hypothetical protein